MITSPSSEPHPPCCGADAPVPDAAVSSAADSQKAFGALLRSVQAAGALDEKTKELILFSLVVQSQCRPCFAAHWARARGLGLTPAQLEEAAWCAIALGGAPVKLFYQECLQAVPQNELEPDSKSGESSPPIGAGLKRL